MTVIANDEVELICGLPLVAAPRRPSKEKGAKLREWQQKLVPHVLRALVDGKDAKVGELADAVELKSPNFVATALGGCKGGGLNMWKNGTAVMACQQNAAIAIKFRYGDVDAGKRMERVAADLDMEELEVLEALQRLPVAK